MSGPKVVTIVTREELRRRGELAIQRFDRDAEELRRFLEKHDEATEQFAGAVRDKRRMLEGLLSSGRWNELQNRSNLECDFLRSELERRRSGILSRAEADQRARRQTSDSARSVIWALEAAGLTPSAQLRVIAQNAFTASDEQVLAFRSVIDSAYAQIRTIVKSASNEQKALADRLGKGEQPVTVQEWLNTQQPPDKHVERLDRLLAEITLTEDPVLIQAFRDRVARASSEPSDSQRRVLTDSITIELASKIREIREASRVLAKMNQAYDLLTDEAGEISEVRRALSEAITTRNAANGLALVARAQELAAAREGRLASLQRRRAILDGLATLGYEIRENMATGWVASGTIVVKKPGAADYGVELGATPNAEHVQVRVVGAASPTERRTAARDKKTEEEWCTDFSRLRQLLAEQGSETHVERAIDPGLEPVKTISFEESERIRMVEATANQSRTRSK